LQCSATTATITRFGPQDYPKNFQKSPFSIPIEPKVVENISQGRYTLIEHLEHMKKKINYASNFMIFTHFNIKLKNTT